MFSIVTMELMNVSDSERDLNISTLELSVEGQVYVNIYDFRPIIPFIFEEESKV